MRNSIIVAIIIGLAIVFAGFMIASRPVQFPPTGATPGTVHYNTEYFNAGLVQGGSITTITAVATTSLTVAQLCNNAVISWSPKEKVASTSWANATPLVATCLPTNQDTKTLIFRNTTTTAGSTIVFATTSTNLATSTFLYFPTVASSTDTGSAGLRLIKGLTLDPLEEVQMTLRRVSSTEAWILLEKITPYK